MKFYDTNTEFRNSINNLMYDKNSTVSLVIVFCSNSSTTLFASPLRYKKRVNFNSRLQIRPLSPTLILLFPLIINNPTDR